MEGYAAVVFSGLCVLLFMVLGLPLANRRITPNRWYGYRASWYQFEDEEIWYRINFRGGVHTFFCGLFRALFCWFSLLFAGRPGAQSLLAALLGALLLDRAVYEIAWSVKEARRMAVEKGLKEGGRAGRRGYRRRVAAPFLPFLVPTPRNRQLHLKARHICSPLMSPEETPRSSKGCRNGIPLPESRARYPAQGRRVPRGVGVEAFPSPPTPATAPGCPGYRLPPGER